MTDYYLPRILLIDDDLDDVLLFEEAIRLVSPESKLLTASSCGEAMKKMSPEIPNAIFMDLITQATTGIDCIKLIRQDPALTDIPIVVLSTYVNPNDIDLLYELGVKYFITKPPSFIKLQAVLSKMVNSPSIFDERTRENFHIKEID